MDVKSIKKMILGISITLFGGFMFIGPTGPLAVVGFIMLILGLVISIVGFLQKD